MVGTIFCVHQVARLTIALALCILEQRTLEVQVGAIGSDLILDGQQVPVYELSRRFQPAIQVEGPENSLEGVTQDRCALTAPGKILLPAQIEEVTNSDVATLFREDRFADEQRFDLGQISFPLVDMTSEEVLRDDEIENGITQEFQPFVGRDAFLFVCVDVRSVFEREFQQIRIRESIPQPFLQADQPLLRFVPEPTRDTSQYSDLVAPLTRAVFFED